MKKLLIVAFSLLATTAFCAEKTTKTEKTTVTTAQMTETNPVMTTEVSLGDSFMAAFGMNGNTSAGGTSEGGSGTASSGSVSSALNVSTTIANGSVTIATPYGNAMHK